MKKYISVMLAVLAITVVATASKEPEEEYIQLEPPVQVVEETVVEVAPVVVASVPEEPEEPLYDVPLDEEVQRHIIRLCDESGIPPAVIIAMAHRESRFTPDIIGDNGNAYGLLQIWPKWHGDRMERLGVTDLLDPCQNVTVAVDLLAELLEQDKGLAWALMAYNAGPSRANELYSEGKVSEYAASVLASAETFEEGRWSK